MKQWKTILLILAALVAVVLIVQNHQPATVRILFATVSMPLILLLAVVFLLGFMTGSLGISLWRRRR